MTKINVHTNAPKIISPAALLPQPSPDLRYLFNLILDYFSGETQYDRVVIGDCVIIGNIREGKMAPQVGFEPTTLRLTAECSTVELLRSTA